MRLETQGKDKKKVNLPTTFQTVDKNFFLAIVLTQIMKINRSFQVDRSSIIISYFYYLSRYLISVKEHF